MSDWEFKLGDIVRWPNGIESAVCGIDNEDATLMDDCGGWIAMVEVDPIKRGDA